MPNRLADEQSPYLLQHKDNPVDWYPWSEEAFQKARDEDKPIFLSIGYSTCHWCHVMEHESFEDEDVARLMNDAFVSIKVDREERPDVDGVYMAVCQMMTGQGGWPLTILMTPDKLPFHASTYIPKHARFGRIGMMELVPRIKEVWINQREDVLATANEITEALKRSTVATASEKTPASKDLRAAYEQLEGRYDQTHGGFGEAPKFPSPHNLLFLLRYWHRTGTTRALEMTVHTLEQMRAGGLFDHVGYGFHRYSTDRSWLVPHFEKMLYDQAMLAMAYTEVYQATGHRAFRRTADEIFEYVQRDLRAPEGAFYSAEDADSEGREGKFYVWRVDEVKDVLDPIEADLVIDVYGLKAEGNFEEEATRQRTGENILHLDQALEGLARQRSEDAETLRRRLLAARAKLFARREQRIRPGLDDKILADWNGLMIAALAKAAAAFEDTDLTGAARAAASFVLDRMWTQDGGLLHRYRGGEAAVPALLDDYAYMVWGLLELYEADFDPAWLEAAIDLTRRQVDHFWDDDGGGFFFTADDAEELLVRRKELYDGAIPSGNAVSALNLLRLERITGDSAYGGRADAVVKAAGTGVRRMPSAFTGLLAAITFGLGPTREIVITGKRVSADVDELIRTVRGIYLPNKVVIFRPAEGSETISALAPFVAHQTPVNGKATAYVCKNYACDAPVTTASALEEALTR